jgi:putative addiction module component (TIGR02574 family)
LEGDIFPMSIQQLTSEALALPISERVSLAQALWQSIDAGREAAKDREAVAGSIRRDEELSSGAVHGRTHEEVMQAARRAIECRDGFSPSSPRA